MLKTNTKLITSYFFFKFAESFLNHTKIKVYFFLRNQTLSFISCKTYPNQTTVIEQKP